ncbi:MAG: VWA domain-containing protein [Planctomycetota bacterium]|nr:VWA domain-containing protein [Planctomycetota bacterium]MDA1140021.1 VWA domain-containing protein [Planctomycetota bacterium]
MFVSPFLLLLLPLAGLPVIIHMIHRQKYTIHEFSALLFFDRSRKFNVFRFHLRHVLLMLLRILALLLLLFAFARPSVTDFGIGDRKQALVLVLDGSISMTRDFGGKSMLEFAKEQALHSLAELGDGTTVGIVTNQTPPKLVLAPTSDLKDVEAALSGVKPFYRRGTFWNAVELAQRSLENVRASSRQVVVFTDLQKGWLEPGQKNGTESGIAVQFIHLKSASNQNCAIARVDVQHTPITIGRPARFAPVIHNFSDRPVKGLRVTGGLAVEGTDAADGQTATIDIPAHGTVQPAFYFTFGIPGQHHVSFEISADALATDNVWSEAVHVMDTVPVLCLGDEQKGQKGGGLFYLRHALSPSGRGNHLSLVIAPLSDVSKMGLYGYSCVFIAGIKDLKENEAKLIREYVHRGGGLVLFPDAGTDQESLQLLFASDELGSLMPVEILGQVKTSSRISAVGLHRASFSRHLSDAVTTEIAGITYNTRYRFKAPVAEEFVRPLALFDDSSPALLESRFGYGRCVLFAGGCSHPETDLQFRSVFPSLMQVLATELAHPIRHHTEDVRSGNSYIALLEKAELPAAIHAGFRKQRESVDLQKERSGFSVVYSGASEPGYYEMQATYEEESERTVIDAFAVNVGESDSDVSTVDKNELSQSRPGISIRTIESAQPVDALLATTRAELMRILLLALLALVIAENFISWRTK